MTAAILRQAHAGDVAAMHRVRLAVRENPLPSGRVSEADYVPYLESHGRGWLVEAKGEVVAFAIGDARDGNIWALFVAPGNEGQGHGRQLHDVMVDWLTERCPNLWLSTEPGTRAERFYEAAGWQRRGPTPSGELRFERPGRRADPTHAGTAG